MFPGGDELALLVEHLNPIVLAVGDVDPTAGTTDKDIVGLIEISGRGSLPSPGLDEVAILRKLYHSPGAGLIRIVTIGHEDVTIGCHRHAGWPIEPIRTGSGHALLAKHHQHLAVGAQLQDFLAHDGSGRISGRHPEDCLLVVDVSYPQVPISVDREAVGIGKQSRAKTLQKFA